MSAVAVPFGLDFSCNLGLLQSSSVFSIDELLPCSRDFCCQCEAFSSVLQRGREGEVGGTGSQRDERLGDHAPLLFINVS